MCIWTKHPTMSIMLKRRNTTRFKVTIILPSGRLACCAWFVAQRLPMVCDALRRTYRGFMGVAQHASQMGAGSCQQSSDSLKIFFSLRDLSENLSTCLLEGWFSNGLCVWITAGFVRLLIPPVYINTDLDDKSLLSQTWFGKRYLSDFNFTPGTFRAPMDCLRSASLSWWERSLAVNFVAAFRVVPEAPSLTSG
jgi:hypothetical protein